MKPFFSIVIPTFNDEASLPETVASVLAQSFRDFEIIVANDGGSDPSEFLAVDDARLQIVNLPANGGVSTARNAGFARATGEYVYFLDSDDLIAPDLLMALSEIIREQAPKIIVFGHITVKQSLVETGKAELAAAPRDGRCELLDPFSFYQKARDQSGLFIPSVAVFQRAAMRDLLGEQPWHTGLRNNQDTFIFMQMGAVHPTLLCYDKFVLYILRDNSLSRNKIKSWTGRVHAMELLTSWLPEHGADPRLTAIARAMRHIAVRRIARLHRMAGQRAEGRQVLRTDLLSNFHWKTAMELCRHLLPR